MSGRTWIMMILVLGVCWGGFVGALLVRMRQQARRGGEEPGGATPGEAANE